MKSLVDIMGGTISVKSELGKGTEFIVDLYVPLAEAEVEEHSEENITENLMDARILLVEDSEINIYVASADPGKSRMCGGDCKRCLSLP